MTYYNDMLIINDILYVFLCLRLKHFRVYALNRFYTRRTIPRAVEQLLFEQ